MRTEDLSYDLLNAIKKSNELKEHELAIKTREVFALEKSNSIQEANFEDSMKLRKKEIELKECELEIRSKELFAIQKANELKEKELFLKEKELALKLELKHHYGAKKYEDLSEEEKLEVANKIKNFFN